jgi:hypothetical protein
MDDLKTCNLLQACAILHAPDFIQESIMTDYAITSKESKNAAMSELKDVAKWIEGKSDLADLKYAAVLPFLKLCNESLKRQNEALGAINATLKSLKEANPKPTKISGVSGIQGGLLGHSAGLSFEETIDLCGNYYVYGSTQATEMFCETFHCGKDIIAKIDEQKMATDVLKEKIAYVTRFHGVDAKGNLVPW